MNKANYNIDFPSSSDYILNYIKSYTKRVKSNYDIQSTVLLVLDMQNYFLDESSHAFVPSAPSIIPNINKLIDFFVENKGLIVYSQHYNNPDDSSQMCKWWKDQIKKDDYYYQIDERIIIKNGVMIEKKEYDAFYETYLLNILNISEINSVIITGVMTNLCVETTARNSFVNNFETTVIADATAAYNLDLQKASLLSMSHGIAYIDNTNEFIQKRGLIQ